MFTPCNMFSNMFSASAATECPKQSTEVTGRNGSELEPPVKRRHMINSEPEEDYSWSGVAMPETVRLR